jgi:signal transduction histidine kinase
MPQDDFGSVVQRMSHALEQLVSAPAATALLRDVVQCAAEALSLERVALVWLGGEGPAWTQTAPARATGSSLLLRAVPGARGGCVGLLVGSAAGRRDFCEEETRRFAFFAELAGLTLERAREPSAGAFPQALELLGEQALRGAFGRTPTRQEVERAMLALGVESSEVPCLALEQARWEEARREALAQAEAAELRLRLLADVGGLLSGPVEWESAVSAVAQLVVRAFADWCAVDFLDANGALRRLTVRHARPERARREAGLEACLPERARPLALTEVVRSGKAQLHTGLGAPERAGGSLLVLPLVARQRTLGVLSFVRGPAHPAFGAADRAFAEDLAARVGLVIDNARLLREARAAEAESRRHAARLRVLVDVDRLLAEAGLDLRAVLDVIAHKVSEVLGDGCVVQLTCTEGTSLEPVTIHHPDPEARWLLSGTVHARRQRPGEGLHGGVALRGQAVLLSDVDAEAARASGALPEYVPYLERYGAQSLLVVPLMARRRVFGTLGVVRDVTAGHCPYHEEDRLLLQSLAERAALAIADARAYGAATEAVRLRDDFLSVAGHELKTPLSALRLQIQVLGRLTRDAERPLDLAQRVNKAERTSERLVALVDGLLDVGRITAGQLQLEREEVDLVPLAHDAVGRMTEALGRGGCEVRLLTDATVRGRWDRVRLEQVLGNLLSNAAKYGRGRPVEVRVEALKEGGARLRVRDEGLGIAPEDQPRIFERFERAVSDPHLKGLGLGLWISREIIDAHGGSIHVDSAPGAGATFTVELPGE